MLLGVTTLPKTIVTFILVIGVLIAVHEFGHYIVAKLVGVRVEEYALGFGPKLFGFTKGETLYSLRLFPLGGFCKMTGEFPHAEKELEGEELETYRDAVQKGRALYQKSILQRFGVIFTGPLLNFLFAGILLAIVTVAVGIPFAGSDQPVVGDIFPGRPADNAGLKIGDEITAINDNPVNKWEDISQYINQSSGEIKINVKRKDAEMTFKVDPKVEEGTDRRVIGILPKVLYEKAGFGTAIVESFRQTWLLTKGMAIGFWQMITRQIPADIGGPVLIAKMVGDAAEVGWVYLLRLMALISVNLGIINLIPFPALDGGRILFLGVELIRGKAVDPEKEGFVHLIGFFILISLIVLILYKDITRLL
ncbi:MAG: RIP metalloprotease RseP [Halanaerobiales bacterium]|nr:RIP metalloprotease RseP [Halanaerobiales bacterium]